MLSDLQLDDAFRAYRAVVDCWQQAVGDRLSPAVHAVSIQQGILYVETDHSAWIQEIQFQKRGRS